MKQLADSLEQHGEIQGLLHVAIGPVAVCREDVLGQKRAGEHDDGNVPQAFIAFEIVEHFAAIDGRQIEIQQDEIGPFAAEQSERFGAAVGAHDCYVGAGGFESFPDETLVARIVLDEEDVVFRRRRHLGSIVLKN